MGVLHAASLFDVCTTRRLLLCLSACQMCVCVRVVIGGWLVWMKGWRNGAGWVWVWRKGEVVLRRITWQRDFSLTFLKSLKFLGWRSAIRGRTTSFGRR